MRTFTQKWAFLLMVVLFGCCLQVNAQSDLTVADGTSTSSYLPLYGFNADSQGMKGQCLYPADSLTDMAGGSISQITFYCGSTVPAEVWGGTFIVYLGETDESNLSSAFISTDDLTAVYTGTLDATSGTLTIEFDDAYTYQGGNLVVDVTLSVTGNWKSASFLGVNNLTGSGRYRSSGSGTGTATAFLPKAEFVYTPGGSAGPTCDKPESVEANDVTANSATISWIGSASAYNLQYKASSDADWTLVKNLSGNSYSLTGLVSNTAYQVQVQAICGENTSGWKSVSFNTLIGLPYAEHFNSTPSGWLVKAGQLQADGSVSFTGTSGWSFGAGSNGVFDSHAYSNIYGTSSYKWLITPAIPIPEMEEGDPGFQMYFSLALTKYSGTLQEVVKGSQSDDRFVVLVSIDEGANWTILREWNNTGSQYVYDDIAVAGEEVEPIDLSAYAGQTIILAFYGQSTVSGGDNNIHVDDVVVEKIPTCLKPTGLHAVDGAATSSTLPVAWTANSGEGAWRIQYKPAADAEAEWITLDINTNPYTITGLAAFTEYEIRVAAVCSEEDFTDYGKSIIAKTAAVVPFFQAFDTTVMPIEWKRYEVLLEDMENSGAPLVASKNGWNVGLKNGVFGNEHLYLNIKDSTYHWLVSPVIEMLAGYQLSFDLALTTNAGSTPTAVTAGEQNDDQFIVFVSTDAGANWTALGTWGNQGQGSSFDGINTEGQTVKFDLNAYAGQSIMLAFYGESTVAGGDNNLHIANVAIDLIPACERPLSITLGNVTGTTAEVTWDADEDGTWEYGYVANPAADFVPAETDYTGSTNEKIADLSGLQETTDYAFFVRHACSETEKSEPLMKTFKTIQTPAALPYSNDFESANGWMLINGDLENHWVWDENVSANHTANGAKALYISNDNLGTYAYTKGTGKAAMVYASKTFFFDQTGQYSFQYDWKNYGYSTYDYLRVALLPADADLEASTTVPSGFSTSALPEGWIALDGGSRLNQDSAWSHELYEINIDKVGYYKMVLAWRNYTYTSGKNPPAAVDNIKIARILCTKPTHLALSAVAADSATITWDEVLDATFEYALVTANEEGLFVEPETFLPISSNVAELKNLLPQTAYKFFLRKVCGGEDGVSDVISIEFKTECMAYSIAESGAYTEGFEAYEGVSYSSTAGVTPDCWATGGTSTYAAPHVVVSGGSYAYVHDGQNALNFCASANSYAYAMLPFFAEELNSLQISFWAKVEDASNGTLSLCYITSEDIASFNQIATVPCTTTMTKYEFMLDEVPEEAARLVFVWNYTGSSYYSAGIDDITVEEIPSCLKPTDLSVIDSLTTTTSATITWTAGLNETNWLVQYKKSEDSVWMYVPESVSNDTLLLAGLDVASVYNVRIAAWCNIADSTAISEYTNAISVATLCEPYSIAEKGDFIEGFESYQGVAYNVQGVVPVCWETGGTSTYAAPHVVASGTYAYVYEGNNSLNFCASAGSYAYAVLPEFADSLKFLQISFWAQMESATDGTLYLGYVDSEATFHDLTSYANNTGSMAYYESKLDTIPGEAIRLAFVWDYSGSSYYSCCIDDIKISYIPNCVKPENVAAIDSLTTATSVILTWDAQGEESAWTVRYKLSADSVWTSVAADNDTILIEGLKPASYYDVQVAAICGATETSEYSIPTKFVTGCAKLTEFPISENFDLMEGKTSGINMPLCWSMINTGSSTTYNYYPMVYKGATYANSGTNSLKFYSYYSSTAGAVTDQYAILPEMEGISALRLRFNARRNSASNNATFTVGVMTDPADASTYVALDTITPAATTYEPFRVLFNEYEGAGKYIAIKMDAPASSGKGFYLDDIVVDSIPNCLEPGDLEAVLTKGQGSIATLNWAAGAASAWEVQYAMDPKFAQAVTANVNEPTIHLTGLTSDSTYYARVKAICGENEESDWSNVISFTPMNAIIINDGTTTSNYVPLYGYYVDMGTSSQFIIPEKEIADITWDSITQLTFYTSSTYKNQSWSGSKFDVYVAETTDTVLNAMVAWTSMTKIVNSKHLELVDQQMVVTLDKPFQYQGGNLIIGVKETVTGDEGYSYWYGKTGVSGNSIYEYGTSSATKSNFNPKMKIDHVHGEMPTCFVVKNIAVSDITASSAALTWTPGTEDQNAWQVVYSADPAFDLANVAAEDIHDVAALPYAIAELATDTLYKVYVRANCSDEENEDYSLWSELFTFHTASACQTPSDIEASEIGTTSALISWNTYGQTGFNLAWSDGTNFDTIYNVNSPYLFEGLTQSSVYRVKVQNDCSDAWSLQYTFKTAYGIPFEEKFSTTSIPTDWNQYSGKLNADGSFDNSKSSTYSWAFGTFNGVFDSHTKLNICGTTTNKLMETPVISLEGDIQLTFDLALTKYSGTLSPITVGSQADDKFIVAISTDNGAHWTVLRQWDNAGSEYVYDNIPCSAEGEQVTISLAAYAGQSAKVAFYGESSVTGGDNNLHIDNVLIDLVPSCTKPQAVVISDVYAHSAKIAWTAEEGQSAWDIALDTIANFNPDTLQSVITVNENPYTLMNLDPSHTYYVYVRANCGEQDGVSRWADVKSFTTTVACPAPNGLAAVLTPGNGTIATLTWEAAEASAWQVEYSLNSNMLDSIVLNVTEPVANLTGLTAETTYYARVKADCGELDGESVYSAIISFLPTDIYSINVNDGTNTNSYVPIYGSYVDEGNTASQFIVPAADLEEILWDSITSLTFYASTATANWGAAEFEIYMTTTEDATLAGLVDWDNLTQVMVAGNLSIQNNKMVVTLSEPFQYTGDNLLIGFKQTVAGSWVSCSWYGKNTTGASIGGYGTGNNMTQRNFLPKMTINYVPGQAPDCMWATHLNVSNITAEGATIAWDEVEGANWEYALVMAGEEPAAFSAATNPLVLDNLFENTAYVFYLRNNCGEENSKLVSIAFSTIENIEAIPYETQFADAATWKLANSDNAWTFDGNLFISNNGQTYGYDDEAASVSYATKLFDFDQAGDYTITYFWKAVGEYDEEDGAIDYLRVALIPAEVQLTAGVAPEGLTAENLPAGWIALDGGEALVNTEVFTRKDALVTVPAGHYRVAFIWINDDSFSNGDPAAINCLYVKRGDATGIQEGSAGLGIEAIKFIENDHVYILVNGVIYDMTGSKVNVK